MKDLPDFLRLTDEQVTAERQRQDRLRRDFNTRVRLSPAENEMARAVIIEPDLRKAFEEAEADAEKVTAGNRLAEALAAQGRFIEAVRYTTDVEFGQFCTSAANATTKQKECNCPPPGASVGNVRVKLPKIRIIKEIYSLADGFGFLTECNTCGDRFFTGSNPLPETNEPKPDTEILKA